MPVRMHVAAEEESVERPHRQGRRERVDDWPGAPESLRREESGAEARPDVVEVAADDDGRSCMQASKGFRLQKARNLELSLRAHEAQVQIVDHYRARRSIEPPRTFFRYSATSALLLWRRSSRARRR